MISTDNIRDELDEVSSYKYDIYSHAYHICLNKYDIYSHAYHICLNKYNIYSHAYKDFDILVYQIYLSLWFTYVCR